MLMENVTYSTFKRKFDALLCNVLLCVLEDCMKTLSFCKARLALIATANFLPLSLGY